MQRNRRAIFQFAIFCCVGAANTLLGLAIIFALKYSGISDLLANAVGYGAGIGASFAANKIVTFSHSRDYLRAAMRFLMVQIGAYALNLLTVFILLHRGLNSYVAQALGVIPYALCGFLGAKFFAFAHPDPR
jgi:putative flippase GtrA